MQGIRSFLDKFKHLTPPNKFIKKEFILCIKQILDINIKKENLSIQNNIIYINTSPTLKSEIFIKKNLKDHHWKTLIKTPSSRHGSTLCLCGLKRRVLSSSQAHLQNLNLMMFINLNLNQSCPSPIQKQGQPIGVMTVSQLLCKVNQTNFLSQK